jgi:hypothetical protein
MPGLVAIEDLILRYDPELPQERFRSAGMAAVEELDRPPNRPGTPRANSP